MQNKIYKIILLTYFAATGFTGHAQVIDHTSTFRNINQEKYFRLSYDNDFFREIDLYYSQGLVFEYVHPAIRKFPLAEMLCMASKSKPRYGLALDHWGYTPDNTSSAAPVLGDRPYAACLAIKIFSISTDSAKRIRIASAISTGVIGPAAGGKELQTAIHNLINDKIPQGWDNQVRNNIILNYRLNVEKEIFSIRERLMFNVTSEARLGTFDDRLSGGLNLMAGHFKDPLVPVSEFSNRVQYFIYSAARVHLVGYNASLQGGFFDKRSPYTISCSDISRITFQWDAGLAVHLRKLFFHYSQSFITKEFRTGKSHRWGGVSIGYKL